MAESVLFLRIVFAFSFFIFLLTLTFHFFLPYMFIFMILAFYFHDLFISSIFYKFLFNSCILRWLKVFILQYCFLLLSISTDTFYIYTTHVLFLLLLSLYIIIKIYFLLFIFYCFFHHFLAV